MPTEGEQGWSDIDSRLAAVPTALGRLPDDVARGGGPGTGLGRAAVPRGRRPGRGLDRAQRRAAATCSARWSPAATSTTLKPQLERHAAAANAAFDEFGGFLEQEMAAARVASATPSGRERYALALPLLPRRHGRPRGDLRLGLGGAEAALRRHGRDRRPDPARGRRATRRSPTSRPTRPAGSRAARRSATGCRSSPTGRSTSSPTSTSTSPSRSAASSAGWRRPTTAGSTTPARRRTSAVPGGCGGRCPTGSTPSPRGAR